MSSWNAGESASRTEETDWYLDFHLAAHPDLPATVDRLIAWSQNCLSGRGCPSALILAGGPGVGKTHLARIVYDHYRAGGEIAFVAEPNLFEELRASYGNKESEARILAPYRRANVLVYDDLGTGNVRSDKPDSLEWLDGIYWRLFNNRHEARKATLITTNLPWDRFMFRVGGRTLSRLQGAMGSRTNFVEMFHLPDYRARGWANE